MKILANILCFSGNLDFLKAGLDVAGK